MPIRSVQLRSKLRSRPSSQDRLEDRGRLALHRRGDVRVEVKGDRDRRVAEHLGDDLRMDAAAEEQRRGGVAKIVEADARQTRLGEHTLEGPPDSVGIRRTACLVGEHEVEFGPPAGGREALRDLARSLATECDDRGLGELHFAP